jgi:polyhydroxyalkanoate synthase
MLEAMLSRAERRADVEIALARERFINGLNWLLRDPSSVVGRTPWVPILEQGKLVVRRYGAPGHEARFTPPVLCVPPLGVRPFIFDLYPEQSVVGLLLEEGFAVYLVDFGVPDATDQDLSLDDYVVRFLPAACEAVRADSGSRELSLVGYCLGAIFAMAYVVANQDEDVRNVIDVSAPVNEGRTTVMSLLMQLLALQTEEIVKRSNGVSAETAGALFRMITPVKNVTRYADLFLNMWDKQYVDGFDAMNEWMRQLIGWPRDAYLQMSRDFQRKNLLAKGRWVVSGRGADLADFRASLLVLAGKSDALAAPHAVRAVIDLVGSEDKTFREVPGGHMGVLAGHRARAEIWRPAARWLAERSDAVGGRALAG